MGDLSKNFSLWEAEKSQTAERLGIDNSIPEDIVPRVRATATMILQPVRDNFKMPFSPSSWYRCQELNRAIGSKDTSQHITGHAVDFEVPNFKNFDVALWIMRYLDYDNLILELYKDGMPHSGWIHCSYVSPEKNRRQVLRYDGKTYKPGLIG